MGSEGWARGGPGRPLRAVVVFVALVGALLGAPSALANLYTVNSAIDTDNGACDAFDCTLREAIDAANENPGPDFITFQIGVGGSATIQLFTTLPAITEVVSIDGTTQTGYAGAPVVELDGSFLPPGSDGLSVSGPGSTIRGLAINNFDVGVALAGGETIVAGNYIGLDPGGSLAQSNNIGIGVSSTDNVIGGTEAADRNVISGNTLNGIEITSGTSNDVYGNYIGTDASGNFAVPNGTGVYVRSDSNTIGATEARRNVISGNTGIGVVVDQANLNQIVRNYIGTDADGTSAVPNTNGGVQIVGGPVSASDNVGLLNVISGNGSSGVVISANEPGTAAGNSFTQNLIGTDASGENPLGNAGPGVLIAEGGGFGNGLIQDNTIAYNSKGIAAQADTARNNFRANRIHDNVGLGIDLDDDGVTANDAGDGDIGANALVNFPELTTVVRNANGTVTVSGTYDGSLGSFYELDFYASESCDPTEFGEGARPIGTLSHFNDGSPFNTDNLLAGYVAPGSAITATATDTFSQTSEFSQCFAVPDATLLTLTVDTVDGTIDGSCSPDDCSLGDAISLANAAPATEDVTIDFAIPGSAPFVISAAEPLPQIVHDVILDATTQPGYAGAPVVQLDGSNPLAGGFGLDLVAGVDGSVIRGLSVTKFPGAGIRLDGPPSTVEGNYVGIAPDGTPAGNGTNSFGNAGIRVQGGRNRIGGTTASARNVISGNNGAGIWFGNQGDNVVLGNRIGTNPAGTSAVPNTFAGVHFEDVGPQTIGGGAPGAGNLISGNAGDGIFVSGGGADGSVIQGNTIGLTAAGTTALPNENTGILVSSANALRIGGSLAAQGNIIAGNLGAGIGLAGSSGTRIQGNLIGLNAAGDAGVPNLTGVILENSDTIEMGGTTAGARNVISGGPSGYGIIVGSGTSDVSVQGNYIGTDVSGETGIDSSVGIFVGSGAANITIGGVVAGAGNVISGHSAQGVQIDLAGPGNRVLGNSIGTDKDETTVIANDIGLELDGMTNTLVRDNVIAGSLDVGILVFLGSDSNTFAGNFVGTNRAGTLDLGNADGMRFVNGGGSNNLIGPGNVLAFNVEEGIELNEGTGNRISANSFHDNGGKGILLNVGANNDQAAPTIDSARKDGSSTTVEGGLTSGQDTTYFVEFFATPSCDGQPQGKTYLGFQTVTTNVDGNAAISFTTNLPALGDGITATATNTATSDTSEFSACAAVAETGLLAGTVAIDPPVTPVDLTARGSIDWAIWGYANGGTSTSLAPDTRKAGGSAISDLTNIDPAPSVVLRGLGQFPSPPFLFDWTDGDVPVSETNAKGGLQHDGQGQALSTLDHGFAFDVPADTNPRTLKIYVATNRADGQLTATLSDGSAAPFTDTLVRATDLRSGVYTITYAADSPGQTLHVSWIESLDNCPGFHCDNAAIYAVALSDAFVVNSVDDHDDLACDLTDCTLREAINAANAASGANTIAFAIPGPTPHRIEPLSPLPNLTDMVSIDGTSQPGFAGTPVIALDGAAVSSGNGLALASGSGGSSIQGLAVGNFDEGAGVLIQSDGNDVSGSIIGTTGGGLGPNFQGIAIDGGDNNAIGVGGRNVISGNNDAGVRIDGTLSGADGNVVSRNYIGLDETGTAAAGNNGVGVWVVNATNTTVGGATPADGNVIANNFNDVFLGDPATSTSGNQNTVRNNLIGLSADTTVSFPNSGNGVEVMDAGSNTIADNTIASTYQGIDICGSSNNTVVRNLIGSNAATFGPDFGVFNQGISIFGGACLTLGGNNGPATGNVIGGSPGNGNTVLNSQLHGIAADANLNTVSYNTVSATKNGPAVEVNANNVTVGPGNVIGGNTGAGVRVTGGLGNTITQNSIDGNGGLGIDLSGVADLVNGVTPNDPGDADTGANELQNFPEISTAVAGASTTRLDATLDTNAGNHVIEVYRSASCDPSGNGEGATSLFRELIDFTIPNQPFTITLGSQLPAGTQVTMTATNAGANTSEFSSCVAVTSAVQTSPFVVNTNDDHDDGTCDFEDCSLREAIVAANAVSDSEIHFALTGATTISPATNLPAIDGPMTIDATTQPGYAGTPLVVLDGTLVPNGDGFLLTGGESEVRGFVLTGWQDAAIFISLSDGNTVAGNYIGIDAAGNVAPNGTGVVIRETSSGNRIGGTGPNDRNVISGNTAFGIDIGAVAELSSDANMIEGNYIGLTPGGSGTTGVTGNGLGGIAVAGGSNVIGGTAARNYISANVGPGILLQGPGNFVKGNTIGLAASTDAALANSGCGISVSLLDPAQPANIIGDSDGGGNVISGNAGHGICVSAGTADPGTTIAGNLIGTDPAAASARGNGGAGVQVSNAANVRIVGGNVISGNDDGGIELLGSGSQGVVVDANFIGTDRGAALDLGNAGNGVTVETLADGNIVRENTIRHNSGAGVAIPDGPAATRITANSIDLNGGLGIDVDAPAGVTPNDPLDDDRFQNFPTLTAVSTTSVNGSLSSAPSSTYDIDVFASPACDASGHGEGRTYLGTTQVTTNADGVGSFSTEVASIPGGQAVTAVAISPTGSTSEFSPCVTAFSALATNVTLTPSPATPAAGAPRVKLSSVPPEALLDSQSSQQTAPVNQTPVNQTPINQLAATAAPVNQTPVNQTPVNQTPVNQTGDSGFGELTQSVPALGSIALSSIPLLRTGGWAALLAQTTDTGLVGIPEQNVTLRDVYALDPLPEPLRGNSVAPLRLGELDLSLSTLGRLPAMAFALGKLPLSEIPTTPTGTYTDWCVAALAPAVICGNTSTVFSAGIEGAPVNQTPVNQTPVNQTLIEALATYNTPVNQTPVNQTPVNQTRIGALPVNQTPVNQTPVNQTPVNQTPVNQLSLQAILAAQSPVNQTPVNQTPINQLPVNQTIVTCSVTTECPTLGKAFALGALRPGVTLGELRSQLPASALADWTLADLKYYGDMTIGDLLESLPQPNTFTLADVLLLVLGSPGAQGLSFESMNLFDADLQEIAIGGSTVDYRADFDVEPTAGPAGVVETVAVTSTLPSGFLYVPGSSTTCAAAPPIADPTTTTLGDGRLELEWAVDVVVGDASAVCFTARPGIVLGPQTASLDVAPGSGPAASAAPASVTVEDTLEPNGVAATSPEIFSDSFYLSYLTNSSDVDYARFAAPPAGTVMTFHLSHLPADYDLVVYGPPETQMRPSVTGAVPLDEAPVMDRVVDPTHATDSLPSQTLDDLRLQPDLAMVGVSAMRGNDPEDIVVTSQGSGFYTLQMTGYNGATSSKPYMVRVSTTPPRVTSNVTPRTVNGTVGPALPVLPVGLNTVFLVNRAQMEGLYGSTAASSVMTALSNNATAFRNLGFPNVVLSVDRFTTVQNAYATWNANPGSPAAANGVVQAINGVLDQQIRSQPAGAGLKYLVIVGGDQVMPFARLDDFTVAAGNEAGYARTFGVDTDLFSTFNAGMMLSDDPYGDVNPVPYLNRQLYIPELSVGRLVETPADIVAALNRFVSPGVQGHLDPTTALTTGYDFLLDGAQGVDAALRGRVGGTNPAGLIGNSWTLASLLGAFLPAGGAPSITSLNGHASHYQFEPPANATGTNRSPLFTTTDLTGSSSALTNRLVFSMGCHAGLSVADAVVTAGAPTLDWPQAYAQKGAGAYLGNTGYGYGDSLVVAYSEELNRLFAQRVAAGSTLGNALVAAKQSYYGGLGVFGVYDEKSMAEFTLFGLPMWSVSGPGNTPAPASLTSGGEQPLAGQETQGPKALRVAATAEPAAEPVVGALAVVPDPATGLDAETFDVNPVNTSSPAGAAGTYWSAQDGVQVTQLRPIQPKVYVPLMGTTAHGALITELRSTDTDCVDPVFARPIVDLGTNESELAFGDVAFPSKVQTVRTFVTPTGLAQRIVLVTGQFFTRACATNPDDPQIGVQRLFDHVAGRVFRSSSADYAAPAFQQIAATDISGNAAFAVDVTDRTPTGAGQVKQVVVGVRSGTASVWTFASLSQSASNAARWTGGVPITGTAFEYFVQAVDAAGNVGVSTNKGFYYNGQPAPDPPAPGAVSGTLSGPSTNGWFTSPPTLDVSAPEGVTVEASVDGGQFGPPPASITGDGLHTIDLRGSNGDTARLFVAVDTTPPEIVIGTPANGGQYVLNSIVNADYVCRDSGSGVVTPCTGTVANGDPIDTSSIGTKTFTVNGVTDAAGKSTPAKTVTYTVTTPSILLIDEDSLEDGGQFNPTGGGIVPTGPSIFSKQDVNDDRASASQRGMLRYFQSHIGETITVTSGKTGDEGWFAPNCIPAKWVSGTSNTCLAPGATRERAIDNYFGLNGAGAIPTQDKLDKIPGVLPLRARGLVSLVGRTFCAVVHDTDISTNYTSSSFPFTDANLKGGTLGVVAFEVRAVRRLRGFSSSTLPEVQLTIRSTSVCGTWTLFNAPVPRSSSVPNDIDPANLSGTGSNGYRALLARTGTPLFY